MNYNNILESLESTSEEKDFNLIWNARASNVKTGNVPTLFIGHTKQEAWESCDGCKLRGNGCYAWSGSVNIGSSSTRRAFSRGANKTLSYALQNRHKAARMVRVSAIGDIGRCSSAQATEIKNTIAQSKLELVGYTHHWREERVAKNWRGSLMASCEKIDDADLAVSQGWRATTIVPENSPHTFISPSGNKVVVCPAQTKGNITCNQCRLCNGSKKAAPIIAFIAHGNQMEKALA
jgi:hypothetical protein